MQSLINWNIIQRLNEGNSAGSALNSEEANKMWSRVAPAYNFMAGLEREYTKNQINAMKLSKEDSVLDIGCGIGRLAIPIAKKVKKLTALDVADTMLEYCQENAKKEKVENIEFKSFNWNNVELGVDIQKHDIVFASRSVGLRDIIKLNNIANKYVYLLSFSQYPSLRDVQMEMLTGIRGVKNRKVDFERTRMFGYNIIFNLLYDLGIDPTVQVVEDGFERIYSTKQDAYDDLRQASIEISDDCTLEDDEEIIFRGNVDPYITYENGKYRFLRKTKTFVIGWEVKGKL